MNFSTLFGADGLYVGSAFGMCLGLMAIEALRLRWRIRRACAALLVAKTDAAGASQGAAAAGRQLQDGKSR